MLVTKKYIDQVFSDILAEWMTSPVVREEVRLLAWDEYDGTAPATGWPPPVKRPKRYVKRILTERLDPMREQMYILATNANQVMKSLGQEIR